MNLHDLAQRILPEVDLSLVKVGPRKSAGQPHLWLLCDRERPRAVVKFAPAGVSSERARQKVAHEQRFLRAVEGLEAANALRRTIPRLLDAEEADGARAVVLAHVDRPSTRSWVVERFRQDPQLLHGWLEQSLAWLRGLVRDPDLRRELQVPGGSTLVHGDFSHYNMLGRPGEAPTVIDWEDWGVAPEPYHDALHLGVLVTVAELPLDEARRSFRRHWIDGSDWSQTFYLEADDFFPEGTDPREALGRYLRRQRQQTDDDALAIAALFDACLEELGSGPGPETDVD